MENYKWKCNLITIDKEQSQDDVYSFYLTNFNRKFHEFHMHNIVKIKKKVKKKLKGKENK